MFSSRMFQCERNTRLVVKSIDDSPVYCVAPVNSDGPNKTLHRDLLLLCGFLAPSIEAEVAQPKREKTTTQPVQSSVSEGEGQLSDPCESEELFDCSEVSESLPLDHYCA